jgi:hypothetical protein
MYAVHVSPLRCDKYAVSSSSALHGDQTHTTEAPEMTQHKGKAHWQVLAVTLLSYTTNLTCAYLNS